MSNALAALGILLIMGLVPAVLMAMIITGIVKFRRR